MPAVFMCRAGCVGVLCGLILLGSVLAPVSAQQISARYGADQQIYLKPLNPDAYDSFGSSSAVSGTTLAIGAVGEASGDPDNPADNPAAFAGAVFIFEYSNDQWIPQAYLKAAQPEAADLFGASVALDGSTLVVGAWGEDSGSSDPADNSASSAGAVYVFVRDSLGSWTQQAYLKASDPDSQDHFGVSVAIDGDTLVVGARGDDAGTTDPTDNSLQGAGAVYVFGRENEQWSQHAYLKASNAGAGDQFGWSVALEGATVVVGAWGEASADPNDPTDNSLEGAGAAYVFERENEQWSQHAYLKASNADAADYFGSSVAVDGDVLVVGAEGEASADPADPTDNSAANAGAAYVFERENEQWSQHAYLKASNADADDYFGSNIALADQRVVVGAWGEDSSDQSNLNNNAAPGAGAAYVFRQNNRSWEQLFYLKASNTEANDTFGESVALNGSIAVVGAIHEDSGDPTNPQDNTAEFAGAAYVFTVPQASRFYLPVVLR